MKKIVFTTLVFLTANVLTAQPVVEMKQGTDLKAPLGSNITEMVGQDEESFYVRRGEKQWACFIDKFDKKTLMAKKSTELKLLMPDEMFYENVNEIDYELVKGQVIVVFDVFNKEKRKKVLYSVKIDKSGSLAKGGRNELGSIECKSGGAASKTRYSCRFTPDKTKFVVLLSGDNKELEDGSITYFEAETQKVLSTHALPKDNVGDIITGMTIDRVENNGDVAVHFTTGTEKTKNLKTYTATLKEGNSAFDDVSDEGSFQDDTKVRYTPSELRTKDKQVYAGMYYEKPTKEYNHKHPPAFTVGVYMGIIDLASHKMTAENYKPLEEDAIKKLTYSVKEGNEEMLNVSDKHLISKKLLSMGGNYYFIAEHQYTIVGEEKGPGGTPISKVVSINRELIITQFDKEGTFQWQRIIPKYSKDDGDYDMIKKDGKLYFLYAEDAKNDGFDITGYTEPEKYEVTKDAGSNIVCTSIDDMGTLTKQVIGQNKAKQFNYLPNNLNVYQDEAKTTMIVLFSNGLKARLGTISIK